MSDWRDRYFGITSTSSRPGEDWQARYFGLRPQAPRREQMSDAMREAIAEDRAAAEAEQRWWQQQAEQLRQRRERERIDGLRCLVVEFGSRAVQSILSRRDAGFVLPEELQNIEPNAIVTEENE